MVSVVIPYYNSFETIESTVESVLLQDYTNYEIIIIDDNSNKGNLQELKFLPDPRVKTIKLDKNSGPSKARNIGISEAKGEIIAFLDADDMWPSYYLKKVVEALKKNSNFHIVASKGFAFRKQKLIRPLNNSLGLYNREMIWSNQVGCPSGVAIRSEVFKEHQFDESLRLFEDYLFYITISQNFKFKFISNHFFYRLEGQNFTSAYKQEYILLQTKLLLKKLDFENLSRKQQLMVLSVINSAEYRSTIKKAIKSALLIVRSVPLFKKYVRYFLIYLIFTFDARGAKKEFSILCK